MNRFWGHTLSSVLVAVAAACAFPACAHDDGSLFVHGVLYPPIPNGTTCTYTNDPTAAGLPRGTVDAALTNSYSPEFLLGSSLIAQANPITPQNETNTLTIEGADVQVVDPTNNAQITNVDVLTAGVIEAASGGTPAYLAISATIMNATAVAHFAPGALGDPSKLAEVYVKFYGHTLGGDYIESDQFLFPVDVCNGCLVTVPAGVSDLQSYCSGHGPSQATSEPCYIGQDQTVDCQRCYPINPVACGG